MIELIHPLPGAVVTQTYAEHVAKNLPHYNGGLDLAIPGSPGGDRILCAAPGQVIKIGYDPKGYGNFAKVRHTAEYETLYAHLQLPPRVALYAQVSAGDVLGYVGSTGNSTGPHLHFEVRENGIPIDPAPLLSGQAPQPEPAPEPETFPTLPRARVTSSIGLNIRQAANVQSSRVGWLPDGTVVDVIRGLRTDTETWLQIGYQQWIAMHYGGNTNAVWDE